MTNFSLLIRIRWTALASIGGIFLISRFLFSLYLPLPPILIALALMGGSNLLLLNSGMFRKNDTVLGVIVLFDVLLVTAMLYAYGGHTNPFSTVYLAYITVAGFLLGGGWGWRVLVASTLCFVFLFFFHIPVAEFGGHAHGHTSGGGSTDFHLNGMLMSFFATAFLIALFSERLKRLLVEHERELTTRRERDQRLASLTTLAAGAAHELATPLSTVAVVTTDLIENLKLEHSELLPDCYEIQEAVLRCREIVRKMHTDAGSLEGEMPELTNSVEIAKKVTDCIPTRYRSLVTYKISTSDTSLSVPISGLVLALSSLIKNGLEAHDQSEVTVSISVENSDIFFSVEDRGVGMADEVLVRVGEPFFTTKAPGSGIGLGVFLAKLYAERWHGSLSYTSKQGRGTLATLRIPKNCAPSLSFPSVAA